MRVRGVSGMGLDCDNAACVQGVCASTALPQVAPLCVKVFSHIETVRFALRADAASALRLRKLRSARRVYQSVNCRF